MLLAGVQPSFPPGFPPEPCGNVDQGRHNPKDFFLEVYRMQRRRCNSCRYHVFDLVPSLRITHLMRIIPGELPDVLGWGGQIVPRPPLCPAGKELKVLRDGRLGKP
jgi:hypothetical protein